MTGRLSLLSVVLVASTSLVGGATPASAAPPVSTFSNGSATAIQDAPLSPQCLTVLDGSTPVAANPYPSQITVSGLQSVEDVNATIRLTAAHGGDIAVLLVGPTGRSTMLLADSGYDYSTGLGTTSRFVDLTFDDEAASPLPAPIPTPLFSGTYKPSAPTAFANSCAHAEPFPDPAPQGLYGSALASFDGTDPNGTWSLYVIDDTGGNNGTFAGEVSSWSLGITAERADTDDPVVTCDTPAPVFAVNQSPAAVTGTLVDETDPVSATLSAMAVTSSAGAKTVELSGADAAGNVGSAICGYSVTDAFLGFQAPLPKSTQKAGSTIPVKFSLGVYAGGTTRVATARTMVTIDGKSAICAYSTTIRAYQCKLKMPSSKGTHTIAAWENLATTGTNWVLIANAQAVVGRTNANGETITIK